MRHRIKVVGFFKAIKPYTRFNTYGLEWNKKNMLLYKRKRNAQSKQKLVSQNPEHLLVSVEVDGVDNKPSADGSVVITDNPHGTLPVDFVVFLP